MSTFVSGQWPLVAAWACLVVVLELAGCGAKVRCEEGLCPAGTICEPDTGRCVASDADTVAGKTRFFGSFSAVALPGLRQGFVGHAPGQQSLAWQERTNKQSQTMFIAGPAAESKQLAVGEVASAAAAPDGRVHVAYVRIKDNTLWYAQRKTGSWQVEQVLAAPKGTVGDRVEMALWRQRPAIVYRSTPDHQLYFVHQDTAGAWQHESIPGPPVESDQSLDLGASLAISSWEDAISVATHDAVGRDLILASRKNGAWTAARLHGAGSGDEPGGDVGRPCALARTLTGDLLIAYRDAGRNEVRVLSNEAGKSVDRRVTDGGYLTHDQGQRRRRLVGTALSVSALANGRVAVAFMDASRLRIQVAIQKVDGEFSVVDVPHQGRPQAWPSLLTQVDGTLLVAYLELDPQRSPPSGRILTWTLPVAAVQP